MKGFTLIELIIVIVIIGILAAIAIPKYIDLTNEANRAARDGTVGGIRTAVALYYAQGAAASPPNPAWPDSIPNIVPTWLQEAPPTDFGGYTWTYSAADGTVSTN